MRVTRAGESEENPCRCFSHISFHLQAVPTLAVHVYETKSEGGFLKRKFIFYVMEPAYYSSSLGIYFPGPLKQFRQVILLADLGCFMLAAWMWKCQAPAVVCCELPTPPDRGDGAFRGGLSRQKERSGTDDVARRWELPKTAQTLLLGLVGWFGLCGRRGLGVLVIGGVKCSREKPGGGWVPVWSVLQGKPRDVW